MNKQELLIKIIKDLIKIDNIANDINSSNDTVIDNVQKAIIAVIKEFDEEYFKDNGEYLEV